MLAIVEMHQFLADQGIRLYEIRGSGIDTLLRIGPPGLPGQATWWTYQRFLDTYRSRLLDRLARIEDQVARGSRRLTAEIEERLLALAVAPAALGAARRSGVWQESLRRGLQGDRARCRTIPASRTQQPQPARLRPGDADPEEVRVLLSHLAQYLSQHGLSTLEEKTDERALRQLGHAVARVGQDHLASVLGRAGLLAPSLPVQVWVQRGSAPPDWGGPVPSDGRCQYLFSLEEDLGESWKLYALLPLQSRPPRSGWRGRRLPGAALVCAAREFLDRQRKRNPFQVLVETEGRKGVSETARWIEKQPHELTPDRLAILARFWANFEKDPDAYRRVRGPLLALATVAGHRGRGVLEPLAAIAEHCAEAELMRGLGEACLNGFQHVLGCGGAAGVEEWLTWFSPARVAWLPALVRACAASAGPAAWVGVLERTLRGAEGDTWLAVVHDGQDKPLAAVSAPRGDPPAILTWSHGASGWTGHDVVSLNTPASPGWVLGHDGNRVVLDSGTGVAWEWTGAGWRFATPPVRLRSDADWVINREGRWQRRNLQALRAVHLGGLPGRLENHAQTWPETNLVRLARLYGEERAVALEGLRAQFDGLVGSRPFQEAFWQALQRRPDPLTALFESITRPPSEPRPSEALRAMQVRAWVVLLREMGR
jgi:hypothetical protein